MSRLWIDANVLLRFITADPPEQAKRAEALMLRAERGEVVLIVSSLVVAEVVWVLKSFYKNSLEEIARVLIPLLSADGIEVEDREIAIRAVELARDKKVDFIDAYLAFQANRAGDPVCTFDENDFRRLPVRWISPD